MNSSQTQPGPKSGGPDGLADRGTTGPPRAPGHFLVVGIGASAGGLEAARKLVAGLPPRSGIAFILIQHLDPSHASMMVELLAAQSKIPVLQAANGVMLEPDHLYIIPPGCYLGVVNGLLQLSPPPMPPGTRLPFDFLLAALAEPYGRRAVAVVLSGTGGDGSLGVRAIHAQGGLVIAQSPAEADYDGMATSAIATGCVDHVLPVGQMAEVLLQYRRADGKDGGRRGDGQADTTAPAWLDAVIDLLRERTAYDFRLYKPGTLERRIERRMSLAGLDATQSGRYLALLQSDDDACSQLVKDLLINVTGFFRDSPVFDLLTEKTIPELIKAHPANQPLRLWVAGCSTGEETYSLTMLLREAISGAQLPIKLQVFASDLDPEAVAIAREGLYPESIEQDIAPARLARFFTREEKKYRVVPELRAAVVFTVQDVLADPPFSRLDMVSCRNLLIYLRPEAQAKIVSMFHFALRPGGLLLLGSAETAGSLEGRFTLLAKSARLYRRIGQDRPARIGFAPAINADSSRVVVRPLTPPPLPKPAQLAELCRRIVLEHHAPAAVLINRQNECLFSLGPTDRYLHVLPGHPTHDLLALARPALRSKLRSAIHQATVRQATVSLPGGDIADNGDKRRFVIEARPLVHDGESLMLICFLDAAVADPGRVAPAPAESTLVADLEQELAATRGELQGAIRNLEISYEEQKAINEEALSVNEEFQSTNEELLTSKEELQSLNEELTALNSQLHETLDRQRTTANDLQNVLFSTDVATLFLDSQLNIRFFTPATRSLFNVIPSDVGRPLADLSSLTADSGLLTDARAVLDRQLPREKEIQTRSGDWYIRRVLPYRAQDDGVEGVVITFLDITERRRIADALQVAKRQAELANVAKTRFLAAASHDLRQPLQTLALLHGLLAKTISDERGHKLLLRLGDTLGAMSGMLNALLDINQIEAGTVHADVVAFPISDLLNPLGDEFFYHAESQGLVLKRVPCSVVVESDPRLLEQMIRNLLSNALKYTKRGKLLLGCRRRQGSLSIEIWDTGIGIPPEEQQAIFEEYHQLDNPAREQSRGLGLGLSIVQRLAMLLGHEISVHSQLGRGSCFAIDVAVRASDGGRRPEAVGDRIAQPEAERPAGHRSGTILLVEDDAEVRDLLEMLLKDDGHRSVSAPDGVTALELVQGGTVRPDLILADYNLPNGLNGLELAARVRQFLARDVPVLVLTGDISTGTLRDIAGHQCVQLNKPVQVQALSAAVQRLLAEAAARPAGPGDGTAAAAAGMPDDGAAVVVVIDDDSHVRDGLRGLFEETGMSVVAFPSAEAFLADFRPVRQGCLLIDAYLPGISGLDLLQRLQQTDFRLPTIMITGKADVAMAVQAMKAGAADFIEKPIGRDAVIAAVGRALDHARDRTKLSDWHDQAAARVAGLTARQLQIMDLVLAGHPSKNIAADLGISQRTVENHRASIMGRTGAKSLPELARLALAATTNPR